MQVWRWLVVVAVLAQGCGGSQDRPPTTRNPASAVGHSAISPSDAEFARRAESFYQAHMAFRPHQAIVLGHHEHDGKVPDRSRVAIAAEVERLERARAWLEGLDVSSLSSVHQLDREILLAEVRKELFELDRLRVPSRQPIFYFLFDFSLSPYIDRDYAPAERRAQGLLRACRAAPGYYHQMFENLDAELSIPAVQVGLMMAKGTAAFVGGDLRKAAAELATGKLAADLDGCLTHLVGALEGVQKGLAAKMGSAKPEFALGKDTFLAMLAETQGFEVSLDRLVALGQADLARNLAAIEEAAGAIDPKKPAAEVVKMVSADKPEPGRVIALAQQQVADMKKFVADRSIATIVGDGPVEVRPSPSHRRGNFAMLSSAGSFESKPLPSFYYIAPPDPSWPLAQQKAYLPSRWDLLFVTVHEVWPGHFLQNRHIGLSDSKYAKSFETYSTSEGWAHYVEEMMWEAGVGGGDPRAHIGQLKNALLRNVRFLVALGMHTGEMTVAEATELFQTKAFADPKNAMQQAMRGTMDPMYLSYTLGKLAIRKLHDDWKLAKGKDYSLQGFHDEFLRHGEAPLPVIRQRMLGPNAGPVL